MACVFATMKRVAIGMRIVLEKSILLADCTSGRLDQKFGGLLHETGLVRKSSDDELLKKSRRIKEE
jgi:hypothetical protein